MDTILRQGSLRGELMSCEQLHSTRHKFKMLGYESAFLSRQIRRYRCRLWGMPPGKREKASRKLDMLVKAQEIVTKFELIKRYRYDLRLLLNAREEPA